MYAIIKTGGKQHRVEEGRTLKVDRLSAEEGSTVELPDVLLLSDDGDVTVGTPTVEGARVLAQVESHGRAKKIIVFKYRAKVRTRKKTGHRQGFTQITVSEILRPGQKSKEEAKPKRRARRKAEAPEATAAEAETPTAAAATATEAEAPEKPKRRTRKKAAEPSTETPVAEAPAEAEAPEKPKRRTRKKAAEETPTAEGEAATDDAPKASEGDEKPKATRRKTVRKPKKEDTE